MAQRLIRRLCKHCKESYNPSRSDLPGDFPWDALAGQPVYRSTGCRECRGVGYAGRLGIYELLVAEEEIRELALRRSSSWEIRKTAVQVGMRTLRMDAWDKVIGGTTSVEEALRVTKGEAI